MSTIDTTEPRTTTTAPPTADRWHTLLRGSAAVVAASAVLMQAAGRFLGPSYAILAVVCLVGLALPRQRRRAAGWALGVANLLSLLLHGVMTVHAVQHPEVLLAAVLSVTNTTASVLVVVAAGVILRRRSRTGSVAARLAIGTVGVCVLFAVVSVAAYATRDSAVPRPGERVLVHEGLSVSPTHLVVDGDEPTLVVRNTDPLYVRSFDIDALDLHVMIPPRTAVRITVPSESTTYDFYDYLTFTTGTRGTLEIR